MKMATLYEIGEDGSRAERWRVDQEPVVVGRSGQAQVNIHDDGVSRRHFLIVREGEDYVIKDLNSRNGTWVDGCRVLEEKLHDNDWILAGRTLFLFADSPRQPTEIHEGLTGPHGTAIITATSVAKAESSESGL
jgi:pSer/pThr/pTyr-binding forkhead associated (FHA) protein